jgi:transitional endoplasmic reticulum ATPase
LIYVPDPDDKARLEIFKIHAKGMPLAEGVDLGALAKMTSNYSGADIDALCREAAMHALRRDIKSKEVALTDFKEAMEKVGPTISSDMEAWYRSFMKQVRRVKKPATPVA